MSGCVKGRALRGVSGTAGDSTDSRCDVQPLRPEMSKLRCANVLRVVCVLGLLRASYEREAEGGRVEGGAEGQREGVGVGVGEATENRCSDLCEEEGGGGIGYKTAPA